MSRLRELMEELCPGGVEYKKLGEIAEIIRGNGLQKKDFVDQGIGCIHYGQIYTRYGAFADRTLTYVTPQLAATLKTVSNGDLVVAITSENVEDVCKCVAWLGEDDIVTGGHAAIVKHKQNPKYLAYLFQTEDFFRQKRKYVVGTKVIEMSPRKLAEIIIPVPPLEIQNEIVKLLDDFTELTAELTEQLMTELTLRKKQYNFYRDSLLNFVLVDDTIVQTDRQTDRQAQRISKFGLLRKTFDVEWKALGEVAYYVRDRIETKNVPVDNYVGVENLLQDRAGRRVADSLPNVHTSIAFTHNDILIGNIRPYLKKIWMANCSGGTNGDVLTIRLNEGEKILHRYLYYTLSSNQFFHYDVTYSKGTKMPRGDKGAVMKYRIPIPPLEVQKKIVSILDRFDALCNDLTNGLPAEIAARKKQYEHYRDKLLTFPRSNG